MPYKTNELTSFGKWIKIRLIYKEMTTTELAEKIGTTKSRISEITRGVIPGLKYKEKIIEILSMDEDDKKKAIFMNN